MSQKLHVLAAIAASLVDRCNLSFATFLSSDLPKICETNVNIVLESDSGRLPVSYCCT